ncbi:MAG: manganese efflux pump MntP family protein [Ignavibacteriaceae bacterium]|nr:manganese efflux pump MntP family protein [Ignavibacteriaceae bacterium]
MGFIETLLLSLGLALDAFAVSLSVGTSIKTRTWRDLFRLPFHFGLFQFLMPVIGWYLGSTVEPFIAEIDHWIALILLVAIGTRMIKSSFLEREETQKSDPSRGMALIMLSFATSIDALAVGFSLALLGYNIWYPSILIGIITAILSLLGLLAGSRLGNKFGRTVEVIGGIILIIIGLKIALNHESALRGMFQLY